MAKPIWTKALLLLALSGLGVTPKKGATNPEMHKILEDTLKERNPEGTDIKARIQFILDDLTTGHPKDESAGEPKGEEKKEATKEDDFQPQCPVFGDFDPNSEDCKKCEKEFAEEHTHCKAKTAEGKANKKTTRKASGKKGDGTIVRPKYANFAELKDQLEKAPDTRITTCMNKELLKGGAYKELVKTMEAHNTRLKSADYKTEGRIKSHIKYMTGKGWVFEEKEGKVTLTGYNA